MRPMVLLACALVPSLVLGVIQAGCSSDDSAQPVLTPPDSGTIVVPEAGPSAHAVTVTIVGKGIVVSNDGVPQDGGPNGFVGAGGGSPVVDCPGTCTAPQGTTLYAYPQLGTNNANGSVNQPGYIFAGWTTAGDGGVVTISTFPSLQIGSFTSDAITATFLVGSTGQDADVPVNGSDGSTMSFPDSSMPSDDSGGADSSSAADTSTAADSATAVTDGGDGG